MKQIALSVAAVVSLAACATTPQPSVNPQNAFFANLTSLCGQKFEGRVVSTEAADESFRSQRLVMHVRDCSADEVRIPFAVGENRSRTWVVTRTMGGVRLKHDHRHEDGTTDTLHWYGGDTVNDGTQQRQEFPVDQFSIDLFNANNASVSTTNVWAMEVHRGRTFAYELRRPNRLFRVEFDLTRSVSN